MLRIADSNMSVDNLNKFIEKIENLQQFIADEADKIVLKDKNYLLDQNKLQLKFGLDANGQLIQYQKPRKGPTGRYGWYSRGYERTKDARGGETSYVDLFLSGKFNRSIGLLQMNPGHFRYISEDDKYLFLEANYTENILGINNEALDFFAEDKMRPQLQARVDNYLGA